MNKFKDEMMKSIRYIIPIILMFLGILTLKHFSQITGFIKSNIATLSGIFTPFFVGFIIAYILNQPMKKLESKFKLKRAFSILIVYGVTICIIVFAWLFIFPVIQSNVNDLYASIPHGISQIENIINTASPNFNFNINSPEVKTQINDFITKVLVPLSTSVATTLSDFIINIMGTVVSYTINIFLGLVVSVYLLLSKEKYLNEVSLLAKKLLNKHYEKTKEFVKILDKSIGVYIVAKAMDSTIYGIICTIILSLIGSKYALFVGIIAGVTNMIPFFGPIIGTIIAVVVNLFFSVEKAVFVLIVMIIVQQLESAVLEPYFVGKQVGVPPIFTMLAVTLAGKYTGFLGILLSVPVTGVILIYVKRFIHNEKTSLVEDDQTS